MKPAGLLTPLPVPSNVWEDVSMDFITCLPPSFGYTVILVVIDRFSKGVHLGALPTHFTAYKVADLFVFMVCKLHGIPKSIVSSYHPQTDGQTEVMNQTIEQYLRAFIIHKPSLWYKFLPWAEHHYNTSVHSHSGLSPYQVLHGKPPPSLPSYIVGSSSIATVNETLSSREAKLLKAQNRMKEYADKHRKDVIYEVGSWVYVKLQPHKQISFSGSKYHKLAKRYYGPYKLHVGSPPVEVDHLPPNFIDSHPLITPLAILDFKIEDVNNKPSRLALDDLKSLYNLEDKVESHRKGIVAVTPPSTIINRERPKGVLAALERCGCARRTVRLLFTDFVSYDRGGGALVLPWHLNSIRIKLHYNSLQIAHNGRTTATKFVVYGHTNKMTRYVPSFCIRDSHLNLRFGQHHQLWNNLLYSYSIPPWLSS
ncbi:hypothetical protein V8G54_008447 [Vigna mungo]|uniref:Integrase catalytic domain-containing protein n=1 Tax=Vigna mungo TaxID=3915 RepID=A0AAQ3P3W8_VIGMU